MYYILSLLFLVFSPETLEGLANVMRTTFDVGWHGAWFWFMGMLMFGINNN